MTYHAHTAKDDQGNPLPECSGQWQPNSLARRTGEGGRRPGEGIVNVANLAKQFATPLGPSDEAELAGLLHDL